MVRPLAVFRKQPEEAIPCAVPVLRPWVRVALVVMAIALIGVFTLAAQLNPYRDGRVWLEGTHTQMQLPPCTFKVATGLPCPSCGMTSSFALLVRGDLWNSLQANWAGTLLAGLCLALIPWGLWSAWRGRPLFIFSIEYVGVRLLVLFVAVMILRWVMVLLVIWLSNQPVGWPTN